MIFIQHLQVHHIVQVNKIIELILINKKFLIIIIKIEILIIIYFKQIEFKKCKHNNILIILIF